MSDATTGPDVKTGPTPDNALKTADTAKAGPVLALSLIHI